MKIRIHPQVVVFAIYIHSFGKPPALPPLSLTLVAESFSIYRRNTLVSPTKNRCSFFIFRLFCLSLILAIFFSLQLKIPASVFCNFFTLYMFWRQQNHIVSTFFLFSICFSLYFLFASCIHALFPCRGLFPRNSDISMSNALFPSSF